MFFKRIRSLKFHQENSEEAYFWKLSSRCEKKMISADLDCNKITRFKDEKWEKWF